MSLPPLKGLKSLNRKLERIAKDAPEAAVKACFAGALVIEGEAKQRCPVDTGMLRGSITSERIPRGAQVGPHTEYAAYVEYGTRHMAAQPPERPLPGIEQERNRIRRQPVRPGHDQKPKRMRPDQRLLGRQVVDGKMRRTVHGRALGSRNPARLAIPARP